MSQETVIDTISKNDWYDVKAPAMFHIGNIGKTLFVRTQGTKITSYELKGHVFEVSLAHLQRAGGEVGGRWFLGGCFPLSAASQGCVLCDLSRWSSLFPAGVEASFPCLWGRERKLMTPFSPE